MSNYAHDKIINPLTVLNLLILLFIYTSFCRADDTSAVQKPFLLLDEMRFRNQPNMLEYGFESIRVIYTGELWPSKKAEKEPNLTFINQYIEKKLEYSNIICLDIEHWPMDIRYEKSIDIEKSIMKFISVLSKFKEQRPDAKLGIYATVPIRDYHTPVKENDVELWENANQRLTPIADNVDYIFPSLYTFYKNPEKWKKYAIANINEAKKYGKPVIPFIWPQYHNSNRLYKFNFIDYNYWLMQLETIYEHADGVVIWSPAGAARSSWSNNAEWWKATLDFINKYNLQRGLDHD